jgi:hypothetical protein
MIEDVVKYLQKINHSFDDEKPKEETQRYTILSAASNFQIIPTEQTGIDTFECKKEAEIAKYCLIHFYAEFQRYFYSSGNEQIRRNKLTASDHDNLRIEGFYYYGRKIAEQFKYE